jgi:hypothetical protein
MALIRRFAPALLAAAFFGIALPAQAAPAPADEQPKVHKFLPDDSGGVFVVNIKQIVASPLYTKNFQKQVDELLKKDEVQTILKDAGLDPHKDIDRIILTIVPSTNNGLSGPFVVCEGRFDPTKLQAATEAAGKKYGSVKPVEMGKTKVYELAVPGSPSFLALVDKNTILFAESKDYIAEALEKAAGKRKTEFKSKGLGDLIEKMDPKQIFSIAATGDLIMGGSVSTNAMGVVTRQVMTLGQQGIDSLTGGLTIEDSVIKGKGTLTSPNAETAAKVSEQFQAGLKQAIDEVTKLATVQKEFAPLVDVLKSVKVSAKEDKIMVEGQGGTEAIEALIKSFFFARASAPVPVAPPPGK